jgi:predicted ArsR family transcriptional regulator
MTEAALHHRVLASDSRQAILAALRGAGRPLSVTEAAVIVHLRPSTTRFHLNLLVSAGLVECSAEQRAMPGRPALRYREPPTLFETHTDTTTASNVPGDAKPSAKDNYLPLASLLAGSLSLDMDPSLAAREAGRRWSHVLEVTEPDDAVDPVDEVVDVMDKLGFAPDRSAGQDEIQLHRCPFEVVAREHRQVVCGVHQGMLEETFARLGGQVGVTEFMTFVNNEPLLCVIRLKRSRHA